MGGYVCLALFGIVIASYVSAAVYAYRGAYWHMRRHTRRGHTFRWIGDWAGQKNFHCSCGEDFANWIGGDDL